MTKTLAFSLAALAITAATGFQIGTKPDIEATKSYEGDGFGIEGVGVCSATESSVDCWNMEGVRDQGLVSLVTARFFASQHQSMTFYFGRKNRYLIVRTHTTGFNVSYGTENEGYVQPTSWDNSTDGLQLLLCGALPAETTTFISANFYGLPGVKPIDIPFKEGMKGSINDSAIEIGIARPTTKPGPPREYPNPLGAGKSWQIILGGALNNMQQAFTFAALNSKDEPVDYVDRDGNVVSSIEFLKNQPPHPGPGYTNGYGPQAPDSKYRQATFIYNAPTAKNAFCLYTNVSPSQIKSLRVSLTLGKRVVLKGFPLDPKN